MTDEAPPASRRSVSPVAFGAFVLAGVAAALLLVAGPASRLGVWDFRTGFTLLRWAAYAGLAAGAVGLLGALHAGLAEGRRGVGVAVLGAALGLGVAYVPWSQMQTAGEVPRIHDVTTDTRDPPAFVEVAPLRADAPNPAEYGGPEVAERQREGYPDLETVTLDRPPRAVFDAALAAAREMGWEMVTAAPDDGRIEATATTFWFGFQDDVVVRLRPTPGGGTELDVRSKSRVGGSDLGANAERIREYLTMLDQELGGRGPAEVP